MKKGKEESWLVGRHVTRKASSSKKKKLIKEHTDMLAMLPHDIFENILSRLPVKYLLRFKSVSKLWEATISDPKFVETHLQQYKNSSLRNLLAWENCDQDEGIYITEILEDHFQFVSEILHSRSFGYELDYGVLCHCDGLYLKSFMTFDCDEQEYVLWNPSCKAYREISPPIIFNDGAIHYGIYYNPMMRDYKVVIADEKRYAIFSCRYNKWNKVKKNDFSWSWDVLDGVSLNGSFYWLGLKSLGEDARGHFFEFQITCFDGKDEEFKKVPMPDCKGKSFWYSLTSSGGHISVFGTSTVNEGDCCNEMSIWKKASSDEKDPWIEFNVQLQFGPQYFTIPRVICWLNEDEVMLYINCKVNYYIYDLSKNTFVKIKQSLPEKYVEAYLYRENLFSL